MALKLINLMVNFFLLEVVQSFCECEKADVDTVTKLLELGSAQDLLASGAYKEI